MPHLVVDRFYPLYYQILASQCASRDGEQEAMSPEELRNTLEIYKTFAAGSEQLSDRRRGYTATFLSFLGVIAVAPFAAVISSGATTNDSVLRPLLPFLSASIVGLIISKYWRNSAMQYRIFINYRQRYLALIERKMHNQGHIPGFARAFAYQTHFLFSVDSRQNGPSRFGMSSVDGMFANLFVIYFFVAPILYFIFLWCSLGSFECESQLSWWCISSRWLAATYLLLWLALYGIIYLMIPTLRPSRDWNPAFDRLMELDPLEFDFEHTIDPIYL